MHGEESVGRSVAEARKGQDEVSRREPSRSKKTEDRRAGVEGRSS